MPNWSSNSKSLEEMSRGELLFGAGFFGAVGGFAPACMILFGVRPAAGVNLFALAAFLAVGLAFIAVPLYIAWLHVAELLRRRQRSAPPARRRH
ncbi:MAG TPA: hypothetical protein VF796_20255 [Humisphaera sp.]